MLANEYFKEERWSDTVAVLRDYLARAKDEGAAYRLLGRSLRNLGDEEAARAAFLQGAAAPRAARTTWGWRRSSSRKPADLPEGPRPDLQGDSSPPGLQFAPV